MQNRFGNLIPLFYQEIILSPGVFRRETARGFYPWGKAHNPYAKCEAFHIAPRLFFMFLFFIPFTILQQCIIYPQYFSTEPLKINEFSNYRFVFWWGCKKTSRAITAREAKNHSYKLFGAELHDQHNSTNSN